jgi:uncharacterized membrane protein YedE/YeeE
VKTLIALVAGLLFGIGLALSGMASPDRVIGFLDLTGGTWDPRLALVMGAGLLVAAPFFWLADRRGTALCGDALTSPASAGVDRRLLGGAAIFGIGWGLVGVCPGPALIDLFAQPLQAAPFVAALIAGLLLSRKD